MTSDKYPKEKSKDNVQIFFMDEDEDFNSTVSSTSNEEALSYNIDSEDVIQEEKGRGATSFIPITSAPLRQMDDEFREETHYNNTEWNDKYIEMIFLTACREGKLNKAIECSADHTMPTSLYNREAIIEACKNEHQDIIDWLIKQNPQLQKDIDEVVPQFVVKGYKEEKNLTERSVAFALSVKSVRTPSFYAPMLRCSQLGEFIEAFSQNTADFSQQAFVMAMDGYARHWGAGIIQKHGDKMSLFIFEPLAVLSDHIGRPYIETVLSSIPAHYHNKLMIYTNKDKLQHADEVNCAVFALDFVFHVVNQEARLKSNTTGNNFFDYLNQHKVGTNIVMIGKTPVAVIESLMPLNLIRPMQSISAINERIKMSKGNEAELVVNGRNDAIGQHLHTSVYGEYVLNQRIEYKRQRLAALCEPVAKQLNAAEVEDYINKSTLEGYKSKDQDQTIFPELAIEKAKDGAFTAQKGVKKPEGSHATNLSERHKNTVIYEGK